MIRLATVEMVTNMNPDNDKVQYTYNTLMRMRIIDIRSFKDSLISSLKEQIMKAKASGVKD
jgi:hypothetical protein